ncbi:MAG: serine/threonine protein kinase [Deltaproteobacteria bacterium]|nr:serine/threonine protein kinase [Deltaproteobacteria bacterium]
MDAAYASARDRLGTTLCNKYHLDEVLGVGGTAVVFKATHRNGNKVAVKLLHDYLCKSQAVGRRFKREGYLANILDHPGTVRVLDDDVDDDGVAFLVLEFLEGETLEERRVRLGGRLPYDEVLGYIDRLLEVLELAHEKNIIHRDIKPSNLFLTKDGTMKVLDFGIARILDDEGAATATKTGQMIGTPAFMPPEQALSKPKEIDAKSDLWAVGATMFTLISGELVHVAESTSEHLVKAATLHARSLARVAPGIPANVEQLCARALAFDKTQRWSSAYEMRRELWKVRLDPGRPIGTTSVPPPRLPTSSFPTIQARRDSDSPASTGMSLSGVMPAAKPYRNRILVPTIIAALAIGGALTFAVFAIAETKPLTRTAGATTSGAGRGGGTGAFDPPPPAIDPPSTGGIVVAPPATGTPAATGTESVTAGAIAASAPPAASGPAGKPTTSASAKATASPVAAPKPATAKPPPAKPASTADVYKPF